MPTWPTQLPNPSQRYGAQSRGNLVKNEFEVGTRQRRRYTYREDLISVQWEMTQDQLDIFRYFVSNVIDDGALAFTTAIAGKNGLEQALVYLVDGDFRASYQPGGWFIVTAELRRVNPTLLSESEYNAATS